MKKLKIALVAPFEEPVPPEKYGGTELVVSNLAETLVKFGHTVYLLASGDSKTHAKLIPIVPRALRKEKSSQNMSVRNTEKYIGTGRMLDELAALNLDIVHNHLGWRLLPFANFIKAPMVTTLHGPMAPQKEVFTLFGRHPYVSISNSQRTPLKTINYVATVYNGINLSQFDFNPKPGKYLAFLGRMSPEKGPKLAIQIAKKTGLQLRMAAKVDAVDVEYFKKEIEPLIDGKQIQFLGEVGPKGKNQLLKNASALLATIQWQEPFGLFIVEAMATGTPVIATDLGSARELVENGKTGFVVKNNLNAFVAAIKKINTLKREDCRQRVEKYFTKEIMTKNYLKVYYKLLSS